MLDDERQAAGCDARTERELITVQRRIAELGRLLGWHWRVRGPLDREQHRDRRGGQKTRCWQTQTIGQPEPCAARFRPRLAHQARLDAVPIELWAGFFA